VSAESAPAAVDSIDAIISANIAAEDPSDPTEPAEDDAEPGSDPEPDDDDSDEGDEPEDDDGDEGDDEPAAAGSKDNPLSIGDAPEDQFYRVKIDGEEVTVSLREALDNQIRHKSFSRRINEVRAESKRASDLVAKSEAKNRNLQQATLGLLSDPAKLDAYMMQHFPDQYESAVRMYAERYQEEQQLPADEKMRRVRARDAERHQRALQQERRRREQLESAQRRAADTEAYQSAVSGPYREAFVAAGSPALDPAAAKAFQNDASLMLDAIEARSGSIPSADEIRNVFELLFSRHAPAAPPETTAPAAAPRAAKGRRRRSRRSKTPSVVDGPNGWEFPDLDD